MSFLNIRTGLAEEEELGSNILQVAQRSSPNGRETQRMQHSIRTARGSAVTLARIRGSNARSPSRRSVRESTPSARGRARSGRSEEHTSELQSRGHLVCRLLLE